MKESFISRQIVTLMKSQLALFHRVPLHLLLIILAGILIYSNTFDVPLVFDDEASIIDNPAIRDFGFFRDTGKLKTVMMYQGVKDFFMTRYIGYLTFAFNYKLHGLSVFGYHAVNNTIHILNALLVYWLISSTLRTPFLSAHPPSGDRERAFKYLPLLTSLMFICHPIQTQAVTYIVQRFTSLATLFYVLSLVLYINSRLTGKNLRRYAMYCLSLVSALLSMKTKEISFTLPFIISLYEFLFFDGKGKKRFLFLIPFLLALLIIPLTLVAVKGSIADIAHIDESTRLAGGENIARSDYFYTQLRVIVTYMRLMLPPVTQNLDYDYPVYRSFFELPVLLSFLLLLSIVGLGIYLFYRSRFTSHVSRLTAFGIFWFFITLSVESSVIPIADVIFEHRVYLPSIGFILGLITAIVMAGDWLESQRVKTGRLGIPLLFVFILLFAGATYARNSIWQDKVTLWKDVVEKSPLKARPHNNLGIEYATRGLLHEAIEEYKTAIALKPDSVDSHSNLGVVYAQQGHFDEAIEEYQIALKLSPDYYEAHNNLGVAYREKGLFGDAIKEFETVLKFMPEYPRPYYNLGVTYEKQGDIPKAIRSYQMALKLKPDFVRALYKLKATMPYMISLWENAARKDPENPYLHYNIGLMYSTLERYDKAIQKYQLAVKLKPDYVDAYSNLGVVYADQGKLEEAIRNFRTAVRLNPDDKGVQMNLDLALRKKMGTLQR